ncbi:MAG TPA: phage holin family protein [Noviherbaspirillum sp.]|uniref:phage holin family protein n=1 Tax=Noviherbaspirillum sp. TaxID=1926288 RepID=UPI002D3DA15E|nr:phage holin family protein [Noviherbaspirillum sp.]HYD94913.1 phage holin family protein [Noviherbaspirillum sp.]
MAVMSALHKSKQLYLITLDRLGDYMDLLRVELKIREQQLAIRVAGFALALLFGLLATAFLGLAIIISFWDSDYRALAAWFVVLLYGAIAGISLSLGLKRFRSQPLTTTFRNELQRDIDVIKEAL